jgi:hypothetical protein
MDSALKQQDCTRPSCGHGSAIQCNTYACSRVPVSYTGSISTTVAMTWTKWNGAQAPPKQLVKGQWRIDCPHCYEVLRGLDQKNSLRLRPWQGDCNLTVWLYAVYEPVAGLCNMQGCYISGLLLVIASVLNIFELRVRVWELRWREITKAILWALQPLQHCQAIQRIPISVLHFGGNKS